MNIIRYIISLFVVVIVAGCHSIESWDDNPRGNFEALWTILDEHYCFFEEKGVDWDEVYNRYSSKISNRMTSQELFDVCAEMLNELRDGHTNLIASFNTSYYRKWWSDYPQNYNARLIEEHYLNFNYRSVGGIDYAIHL